MTLRIRYRKVGELKPYEKNARTHSADQVAQIVASINEFGFTNPILVDEKDGIIAGHGRLMAAQAMKLSKVPTITLKGLTKAQRRAYVIADNKLALNAGWDAKLLAEEVADLLQIDSLDIGLTGFSADEINRLLRLNVEDEDETPPLPEKAKTRLGDIYELGDHRLICGDATDEFHVEQLLNGVKPHLMVTDPPYGVNYDPAWRVKLNLNKKTRKGVENDDIADWTEAWRLFPGDIAYVWHATLTSAVVEESLNNAEFVVRSQIIWNKDKMVVSRGNYHWKHEPCWYAIRRGKAGGFVGDRKQSTVWDIDRVKKLDLGHGTQKPVECMRRPIMNNSSVGQVIYDPFLGSGTTLIACQTEGRHCYGLELDPLYCDLIVKRWEDFTGETATRIRKPKKRKAA